MRISDWSSDVCSSDLRLRAFGDRLPVAVRRAPHHVDRAGIGHLLDVGAGGEGLAVAGLHDAAVVLRRAERGEMLGDAAAAVHVEPDPRFRPVVPEDRKSNRIYFSHSWASHMPS